MQGALPSLAFFTKNDKQSDGIVNASDSYFYISMSHFNEMMEDNA